MREEENMLVAAIFPDKLNQVDSVSRDFYISVLFGKNTEFFELFVSAVTTVVIEKDVISSMI